MAVHRTPFAPWPYSGIMAPAPSTARKGPNAAEPGGSSCSKGSNSEPANTESGNEDMIEPLSDSEAREFEEYKNFNPSTEAEDSWDPPSVMSEFFEYHFNRSLPDKDKDPIMRDFPMPKCPELKAPKLDGLVREQLSRKGQFGPEQSSFWRLACLWADILNPEVDLRAGEVLRVLQRALVLLGNTSHGISVERRKIACS